MIFFQKHLLQIFFYSAVLTLVLKIFKLKLFFEKKNQ